MPTGERVKSSGLVSEVGQTGGAGPTVAYELMVCQTTIYLCPMHAAAINQQIEVIRKATKKATRNKQTAKQFLIDAGILVKKKGTRERQEEGNRG